MGAACQKQFDNIAGDYEQEYEIQKQRFSINSIKVQHQQFRPNSKNVSLGMIDSLFHSQGNQAYNKSFYEAVDGMTVLSPRRSALGGSFNPNPRPTTISGKQLDQQQLHDTHRPFQNRQTIFLGDQQQLAGKQQQKIREPLDLSFYYALGLPEYNYPAYPSNVAKQFQNLFVSEQEDRNGVRYIGEWKDNKTIHGNGVMQSNTVKYIGQFKNGLKHYHGRQIQKNEVYEGHFVDGRRKGHGIRYCLESVEEGQFDDYLIKGRITYSNGNIYEGELNKNQYNGQGMYINNQKNTIYQGKFRNGKLHGQGRIMVNGIVSYEGSFEDNYRHGKGRYNWNSSEYYLGQYCRDKKHGFGELVQGNKKYKGNFVNGHLQGLIKVENLETHKVLEYLFKNGVRVEDQEEQFSFSESEGMPSEWAKVVKKNKDLYPNRIQLDDIIEEDKASGEKRFKKKEDFDFQQI